MIHLNNAYSSLSANLTDQWLSNLISFVNPQLSEEVNIAILEQEILTKLEPLLANVFDDLNKSIIEGEYSENIGGAKLNLDNIDNYITLRANFDITGHLILTAASQDIFTNRFLSLIRTAVKDYKKLLEIVERSLKFEPEIETLFHLYKRDESIGDVNSQKDLRLFKINVQVALIDHGFSFNNETFRRLVMFSHTLSDIASVGSISDILKKKCNFLISKLAHRLDTDKTIRYAIDFQYQSLPTNNAPEFDYYTTIINGHYDELTQTNEFKNRYKTALAAFEASQPLDFDQCHSLIKYFKDIKPNLKKLKKLGSLYESFYNSIAPSTDFDKKTHDLLYCYLENNILSLELDENQFNLDNWEEKFNKYTNRADALKNSNFFPYFKILDKFLGKEIINLFSDEEMMISSIDKLLRFYEGNLDRLKKNFNICQEINYLPFQLDLKSCRTIVSDMHGISWNCFIASSFVLPMDYSYWSKKIENYNSELLKFKTMRDLHVAMKKDKEEINRIKDKLSETDKRHIEILSIFAAIVMFVSGEIQIFSKITNINDAVVFTLFFAFSIGVFVVLIWFVTRPTSISLKRLPITHKILVGLFLSGFVGAGGYLYFDRKDLTTKHVNLDNQIDQAKKQLKLDSINLERKKYKMGK
ncbi:hypothetical protein [Pedobacter sp. UBA4863]|uniref:hypothetical protein n=1 Tax=Pedobacter sp. UBA4863 TaxID=1947060 RepID=UPI0025EBF0AF|nr:hypothetical protein [Pedobacter sp. UBA4863]